MMTVTELLAVLKEMPKDSVVLLSIDAEGNGFKSIDEVVESKAVFDFRYGETYLINDDDEVDEGIESNAVVIWPN